MSDDYKVGYGKPPTKTKFQKGKSGNSSGRPKWKNPSKEPLDFQEALIAELKSPMTINEAGHKKRVPKLRALAKIVVADSFHDKGTRKYLFPWIAKLPKGAFDDEEFYTTRISKSAFDDLWEKIEQDAATWLANSSEATNNEAD